MDAGVLMSSQRDVDDVRKHSTAGAFVVAFVLAGAFYATTAAVASAAAVVARLLWDGNAGTPLLVLGALLQFAGLISAVAHLEQSGGDTEPGRRRASAAIAGVIVSACVCFPLEFFVLHH